MKYKFTNIILILFLQIITLLEANCFNKQKILIHSNYKFPLSILNKVENIFLESALTADGLNYSIKKATNFLIDKGYYGAQIFIPEQNIKLGILILKIEYAKIESVSYQENDKFIKNSILSKFINSDINLRLIEQYIDNLNRAGNNVTVDVKPGEGLNKSNIIVKSAPDKGYNILTGVIANKDTNDNSSQYYNSLNFRRLFTYTDSLALSFINPLGRDIKNNNRFNIIYSIPYEYNRFSFFFERGEHREDKNISSNNINFNGKNHNGGIKYTRTLIKNKSAKIDADIGFKKSNYIERINDLKLNIQSHKLSILEFGIKLDKQLSKGSFSFGYNVSKGINRDSTSKLEIEGFPHSNFIKSNLEVSFVHLINQNNYANIIFNSNYNYQHSNKRLFSSEKFELGSSSSVRGVRSVKADSGYSGQNEILLIPSKYRKLQLFTAFDLGGVFLLRNYKKQFRNASSYSLGCRVNSDYFQTSFIYSETIRNKLAKKSHNIATNILFNL